MSAVASKNLYDLLGNDIDSDGEPKPPPKVVVKQTTTTKKKDVVVDTPPPPAAATGGRGGQKGERRPRNSGNDAAFRDRNAGRDSNVARGTEEAGAPPPRRGYREGPRRGRQYDRHSATGRTDSEKQVNQGWGSNDNEWTDEKVGEEIAQTEAQDENAPVVPSAETIGWDFEPEPEAAPPVPVPEEPEEKVKTYDDYLAERAAKAATLGSLPAARQPNEGSRNDTKWKNATPLKKGEEEDVFIAGKEAKARREKERKQKQIVEIDQRFQEAPRGGRGGGDRGGRGGRGGGDRSERRSGPRGPPRDGGFRQGGGHRGPRDDSAINIGDSSAFPSLGA
ncbi:hypothetical protein EV426DRAFT_720324 [Tirmania nivea]|nr:hypothetical protein EV426DRAFT_720324 [Tirmania nivea]